MLNRVMSMFRYEGLPDTIPQKMLELYIMINGHSVVIEHNDNLYVCFGSWGGEPNEYYMPTKYVVSNPYLKLSKTYTIDDDCILVNNDSMYYGMLPLFKRYATALVENDLSMYMVDINSRLVSLIEAMDDKTKVSAEKFLDDIEDGKLGVVASTAFFEGLHTSPYGDHNHQCLTDLIEYQQYIKASFFNEIGLNANYNMKRESITANESQLNDDMLLPLIDDMLKCRRDFCDKINNMFGTDIMVNFSSSWEDNENELALMQEMEGLEIVDSASSILNVDNDNDSTTAVCISEINDDDITDTEIGSTNDDNSCLSGIVIDVSSDNTEGSDIDDSNSDEPNVSEYDD